MVEEHAMIGVPVEHDRVQMIAAALRKKFGKDALMVAQRQLRVSSAETIDAWAAITDELAD